MRWIINALVLCGYLCQLFEISTSFNLPIHLIKPNSANIRFSYDYSSKKNDLTCLMTHKYGEEIDISSTKSDSEKPEKSSIPSPLNNIVDVNIHRQSIIYEVELSREHGIEIVEGNNFAAVGEVQPDSRASQLGIETGDIILATSATAGDNLWNHNGAEGVKSALSTRFVIHSTVKIQLSRSLSRIPEAIRSKLMVPYVSIVRVRRPIGIHVAEGDGRNVYVQSIRPDLGAARSRRIEVGDQIMAMSASWGNRMWDINSVDSFVVGVKMRTDPILSLQIKRLVPLDVYTDQIATARLQRQIAKESSQREYQVAESTDDSNLYDSANGYEADEETNMSLLEKETFADISSESMPSLNFGENRSTAQNGAQTGLPASPVTTYQYQSSAQSSSFSRSVVELIEKAATLQDFESIWNYIAELHSKREQRLTPFIINKLMAAALNCEYPDFAIHVFEESFGFRHNENPTEELLREVDDFEDTSDANCVSEASMDVAKDVDYNKEIDSLLQLSKPLKSENEVVDASKESKAAGKSRVRIRWISSSTTIIPNNFVCTTAIKAYGRKRQVVKALALFEWFEAKGNRADTYLLTALLYVCAKSHNYIKDAERIFWVEFPLRNVSYSLATVNSLMYLYAKRNNPEEVLKVYELTKNLGLKCNVITYGTLIKALLRSNEKQLQEKSFNILENLPELGIVPGVEVYNQFFEFYAKTHNFKMMKKVLGLMSKAKPRVKPDVISYGYLTNCFAESKKPKSALLIFHQMRKRNIPANAYTYMGVLKSLALMRDGISAVQVITEMRDEKLVTPDKRHFAMAMFTCITGNQCYLAESLFTFYTKIAGKPDAALCSLNLRALLQQKKWDQAHAFFKLMEEGQYLSKPNVQTLNYLLQYQLLDERFPEAEVTLQKIFAMLFSTGTRSNPLISSLEGTYEALSILLGPYSAHMQRMVKQDSAYHQRMTIQGSTLSIIGTNSDTSIAYYCEDGQLKKPSSKGLEFLTKVLRDLSKQDRIFLQADFYSEVLKALVIEREYDTAQRLMKLRTAGEIRLRDDDISKIRSTEEFAKTSIKG